MRDVRRLSDYRKEHHAGGKFRWIAELPSNHSRLIFHTGCNPPTLEGKGPSGQRLHWFYLQEKKSAREEECEYKYEYSTEEKKTNVLLLTRSIVPQQRSNL